MEISDFSSPLHDSMIHKSAALLSWQTANTNRALLLGCYVIFFLIVYNCTRQESFRKKKNHECSHLLVG